MIRRMAKLVVLVCLALCMTGCKKAADVKKPAAGTKVQCKAVLWDTVRRYTGRTGDFYKSREKWKQVPYNTTGEYELSRGAVIENDFFYLTVTGPENVRLYAKRKPDGKPEIWHNSLYKIYVDPKQFRLEKVPGACPRAYGRLYGRGTERLTILKNTPQEIIVEHTSKTHPVVVTYRVVNDKNWLEVRGVRHVTEHGDHGKVRMGLAPNENGNDWVIDSLRDLPDRYRAPSGKMLLCFYESTTHPFLRVITWSSPFKEAGPWFMNDSGPKGDTMWCNPGRWGGLDIPRRWEGSITSSWAKFGKEGCVVTGSLAYWSNWYREQVDKPIKKGEVYTSKWKPPYPGRWRMTARIAEKKYDQGFKYDGKTKFPAKHFSKDVYDGKFTFTSPIDGWLDYVIIYVYDRTKQTPKEIQTPMDQYRWTIAQKKQKEN